jgi:hypothetical protein
MLAPWKHRARVPPRFLISAQLRPCFEKRGKFLFRFFILKLINLFTSRHGGNFIFGQAYEVLAQYGSTIGRVPMEPDRGLYEYFRALPFPYGGENVRVNNYRLPCISL